jgi:hypothetical protein
VFFWIDDGAIRKRDGNMKKMFRKSPARLVLIGLLILGPILAGCSAFWSGDKTTSESGVVIYRSDLTKLQEWAWERKLTKDFVLQKFGIPNENWSGPDGGAIWEYEGVRSAEDKGGAGFVFSYDKSERSRLSRVVFTIDACGKVRDVEPYGDERLTEEAFELRDLNQSCQLTETNRAIQKKECELCKVNAQLANAQAKLKNTQQKLGEERKNLASTKQKTELEKQKEAKDKKCCPQTHGSPPPKCPSLPQSTQPTTQPTSQSTNPPNTDGHVPPIQHPPH